jgi:transposase
MTQHRYKASLSRDQSSLLPARIEDYVSADNPVRGIDGYVCSLDLVKLGFHQVGSAGGAGQPPYDPADLLKLYLYGYLNQVRSSRRLEREAGRNLEVMWLLKGLRPGYRTIGEFRRRNASALGAANRAFVRLAGSLDLLGGTLVAIDGAFFDGNAGKGSIVTEKRLRARLAALDESIAAYAADLDANDRSEAELEKAAALRERQAATAADLGRLEASGDGQLSRTDPDARLLSKRGQSVAGYNVQIAVDAKHKLIVAGAVENDGNDTGQLHALASAAKQALGSETLQAVADAGYFNGETIKACEADAIVPFVPEPKRSRAAADGRHGPDAFVYDAQADAYSCPAGKLLEPMSARKRDKTGKLRIRYVTRRSDCGACPLRVQCLGPASDRRTIERWEHEDVLERHRDRMRTPEAEQIVRKRKALAEHPFGTLKCRAGYRHFLVRGFHKVRGEWSLMMLCYNFTRVLNILGIKRWLAIVADIAAALIVILLRSLLDSPQPRKYRSRLSPIFAIQT